MSRYNLSSTEYEKLYARYLKHSPNSLLELAGNLKGKNTLDLCAGSGRLSEAAAIKGAASITLLDSSPQMLRGFSGSHGKFLNEASCTIIQDEIYEGLSNLEEGINFDVAFCQQGVNYWLNKRTANFLADSLTKNGMFIFNTFNRKPSKKPEYKSYTLNGLSYLESYQLVYSVVHHTQMCEGMEPHQTSFLYLSQSELKDILSPYFKIEIDSKGIDNRRASYYRCIKK